MEATAVLDALFRWIHIVAGIIWIGLLYFFNFVNGPFAATMDGPTKQKVVPELMPRALYWFRWGAAWTWLTGFLLLIFVYIIGDNLLPQGSTNATAVPLAIAAIVVVFFLYDILWKAVKNETAGAVISYILTVAILWGLSCIYSGRAVFILLGGLFGTTMAMNVWMRIWPA